MNVIKWSEASPELREKILKRAEVDISQQMEIAKDIIQEVRERGDNAVLKYTQKFDGPLLSLENLKVTTEEIEQGYKNIETEFKETLEFAAKNIRSFHERQMPENIWFMETVAGVMVGEQTNPISDVCIYVPRGKGSFPSVMLMLAIPALVAKVPRITVITPPNEEGNLDDAVLAAAKVAGVKEIYKAGGIQGVAAVALGTGTIPKCSKIIGPGNSYVTAAKRLLSTEIDIGSPAGPSEGLILSDGTVDAKKVALDLMIEAEHGPDSAALLVTHDEKLASQVEKIVKKQVKKLSPQRKDFVTRSLSNYGGIIITESLEESIDFVNEYAPEHMEVMTTNPFDILPKIKNAGEILLGENAPISLANFVLGPNAILPTGGKAKTYSSVSVFDFLKRTSIGYVSKEGFDAVKDKVSIFARKEGFETHALAVEDRD